LAQPIRLLLAYTETEFTEKRYNVGPKPDLDKSEWLNDKNKLNLNFPNVSQKSTLIKLKSFQTILIH